MVERRRVVKEQETHAVSAPEKPQWKMLNGEMTLLDKRTFKKGDVFEAYDFEVPMAFRDLVERITPEIPVSKKVEEPKFYLQEQVPTAEEQDAEDHTQLYHVIDANSKVLTEKPVTKEEAETLIKELEK